MMCSKYYQFSINKLFKMVKSRAVKKHLGSEHCFPLRAVNRQTGRRAHPLESVRAQGLKAETESY
jgi:hypothetical protein